MNTNTDGSAATLNTLAPHIQEVVRSAEQELTGLLQRRTEIMKRMGTIKQTLAGLATLYGDSILDDELLLSLGRGPTFHRSGFTRACRLVLMEARTPLRVRQACDEMRRRFPDLVQRHKDLAASVTTVLNRLVDYAEANTFFDQAGMRVWEWVSDGEGAEAEEVPQSAAGLVLPPAVEMIMRESS
jgi:chorismate mutase